MCGVVVVEDRTEVVFGKYFLEDSRIYFMLVKVWVIDGENVFFFCRE